MAAQGKIRWFGKETAVATAVGAVVATICDALRDAQVSTALQIAFGAALVAMVLVTTVAAISIVLAYARYVQARLAFKERNEERRG